uniref:PNPLA domain-containing protein n=1 Tax=viral metagenome TaxID=1070528 RepID=A0A6C0HGW7_9ZZZZ
MNNESIIKHLVISGGGIAGLTAYSILREANKSGIWNIENLVSIYGTSAGAIIGVFIALKYDWTEIDNYIIKRPWQRVFKFDIGSVLRSFDSKGIFGKKIIEEMLYPLLKGKDLEPTITMKELYEYSKIDIHIFSTEIHQYETIDISHKTHPEWQVVDAIYASACLPIIFMPYLKDGQCYTDGGITNNYPIYACLENGANPDEVLGITISKHEENKHFINDESSLFDYLTVILNKMYKQAYLASNKNKEYTIKYEIELENIIVSVYDFANISSSQEQRSLLLDTGVEIWNNFMDKCK